MIKESDCMKKEIVLKVTSVVLALMTVPAIVCAVTVNGGGFLDLSNIARAFFIGAAAVCGILAVAVWKYSKPKD